MSKLGKLIGSGSDGDIYELLDDESVVVKYIQPNVCGIENYLEYYILKHISHPNIASAIDISLNDYGVTKITQKKAISNLKKKVKNKQHVMYQILKGVKYLNDKGILHGDIKPSNILLYEDNIAKLNDFSLCRFVDSKSTKQMYTYHYRPPEVDKGIYDKKSEVFALGCTFYEIYFDAPFFNTSLQTKIHIPSNTQNTKKISTFLDLVYRMTENDFQKRLSIEQVCQHPFFADFKFEETKVPDIDKHGRIIDVSKHAKFDVYLYTKKCMNEKIENCIDFENMDKIVCNELNFKIFNL